MASASRPRKSSALPTSRRRRAPARGNVPALELHVALVAGEENLSVNAARGLLRLRQAQLAARDGARGALVKLELVQGAPDFRASALKSPLLRDIFTLITLQLIDDFPAKGARLRALLALWRERKAIPHPEASSLEALVLNAAVTPIQEAIEQGLARHTGKRLSRAAAFDAAPLVALVKALDKC